MKSKQFIFFGLPVIVSCILLTVRSGYAQPTPERIVRLAELEIYPDQLQAYKAALEEEIETSIRVEPAC